MGNWKLGRSFSGPNSLHLRISKSIDFAAANIASRSQGARCRKRLRLKGLRLHALICVLGNNSKVRLVRRQVKLTRLRWLKFRIRCIGRELRANYLASPDRTGKGGLSDIGK